VLIYTLDINRLYIRSSRFSPFRDNSECEASPETMRANNVHCYLPPGLRARVNSIGRGLLKRNICAYREGRVVSSSNASFRAKCRLIYGEHGDLDVNTVVLIRKIFCLSSSHEICRYYKATQYAVSQLRRLNRNRSWVSFISISSNAFHSARLGKFQNLYFYFDYITREINILIP